MTSLSDTQAILLSTASQRHGGSVLPLPASLKPGGGIVKALAALFSRDLVEERETSDPAAVRREQDGRRLGLFITAAGLAAIGIEPDGDAANDGASEETGGATTTTTTDPAPVAAGRVSKTSIVLDLLRREGGATLGELIEATGWLPHTTRAALTGLRKKGHAVERSKLDGATCYRIGVAG